MKKIIFIGMLIITLLASQSLVYANSYSGVNTRTTNLGNLMAAVAPVPVILPLNGVTVGQLGNGLRGDYYSGMNFEKFNTFVTDSHINFDWGTNKSPALLLGHDYFSVRWTGYIVPRFNEVYTFTTKSDDGVRFYLNGQILINDWNSHGEKENSTTVQLTANQPYSLVVEYFQNNGPASMKLYWASNSQPREIIPQNVLFTPIIQTANKGTGVGLLGSYYDGANFEKFKSTKIDETINYQWNSNNRKSHDPFSIRWVGRIQPLFSEIYTFRTISDEGIRVWVNNQKIIDSWNKNSKSDNSGTIQLQANVLYDIKVEYYEDKKWPASAKLYWLSSNQQLQIVPKSQLYLPPAPQPGTGNGLRTDYFNDKELSRFVLSTLNSTINFDWGSAVIPVQGIGHNNFSIRWTGKIQPLYSEIYTFKTVSDDGVRLWVNGKKIISQWNEHGAREDSARIELIAGQLYDIKMEYFQASGFAKAQLYWSSFSQPQQIVPQTQFYAAPAPVVGTGNGLRADYFMDKQLTALKLSRIDMDINFDWGNRGLPVDGVAHDNFSVRWTGKVQPLYSESYTFKTSGDDGIRLWVNNVLLVNDWNSHDVRSNTGKLDLQAGQMYDIRMEYYQETGNARAELYWSSGSQRQQIIPQKQLYSN